MYEEQDHRTMWCGPNDGGIKRGDSAETGDNEAAPDADADLESFSSEGDGGIDDLTILPADDPSLGLTGTTEHPAIDWAADTGPTRTAESGPHGATEEP